LIVSALMRTTLLAHWPTQVAIAVTMVNPLVSMERMTAATVFRVRDNPSAGAVG
jgi:hypothetical protein